jgi:hypothetical protein
LCAHLADKAKALAGKGADQLLVAAGFSDRLSCSGDAACERGVFHDPTAPDRGNQIVLGDDAARVLDQKDQQIEHLRLYRDRFRSSTKLPAARIQFVVGKEKQQNSHPGCRRSTKNSCSDIIGEY